MEKYFKYSFLQFVFQKEALLQIHEWKNNFYYHAFYLYKTFITKAIAKFKDFAK